MAPLKQSPTLYVGDLDPSVDESYIVSAFSGFGFRPVSTRLCRDRLTGNSLCYAYVNFSILSQAEDAMRVMNHKRVKGKPMRIMWSVREPLMRKNGVGNLFVKNLEEWIGGSELEDLFKEYGTIVSCKVALDENGKSRGFGFVQMESNESANSAIVALHGKILRGGTKELYVAYFVKKTPREALPNERKNANLYIKNLELGISDDLLRSKFSEFGKVCSAVIMKDEDDKSRGFGFVSFEMLEQAKAAMDALNGSILGSRTIYVQFAQKKAEREELLKVQFSEKHGQGHPKKIQCSFVQDSNVYVKHLNYSVDDIELVELFSQCGTVISAKVMKQEHNGMSKGFGFVCFSTPEEARKAVETLHGVLFHGKLLYVAKAQRKEDRQKKLQIHFANIMAQPHPTSYNYTSVYPVPLHYGQPRNYVPVPYQHFQYSSPLQNQWAYYYYPHYASSVCCQLQQPPTASFGTGKGAMLWFNQKVPTATVKITYPSSRKQKADKFKFRISPKLLDNKVKEAEVV